MAVEQASDIGSQAGMMSGSPSTTLDSSLLTTAKGGGTLFAARLVAYALRFAIGLLLARALGSEQFGLYRLTFTVASVATGVTLLGLGPSLVRHVSLFASRRDVARVWSVLQAGITLPTALSLLVGAALFALAEPIAVFGFREPDLAPLLRLVAFAVPFLTLLEITAAATQGFKRMQDTAIARIFQPALRLVLLVVVFLTLGLTATWAVATLSLAVLATCILLVFLLNRIFSLRRPGRWSRAVTAQMLRFGLPLYGSSLIGIAGPSLRTLLLGAAHSVAGVGILAVAAQVNTVGSLFYGTLSLAASPVVSELYERGAMEPLERFYQATSKWSFTLNLPLFLIVILFPVPILSIFGQSYVAGASALTLLAWANLVSTGTGLGRVVIGMTGHTSFNLVNSLVSTGLSIGLSILLIPPWGVVGAATAALITTAVISLLFLVQVFALYRILPYNRGFLKPVLAGLAAAMVAWGVDLQLPLESDLTRAIIASAILIALYVGILFVLGLSQEDRAVLDRVRERFIPAFSRGRSTPRDSGDSEHDSFSSPG